jgi:hypothetical protein
MSPVISCISNVHYTLTIHRDALRQAELGLRCWAFSITRLSIHGVGDKTAITQPAVSVGWEIGRGDISAGRGLVLQDDLDTALIKIIYRHIYPAKNIIYQYLAHDSDEIDSLLPKFLLHHAMLTNLSRRVECL